MKDTSSTKQLLDPVRVLQEGVLKEGDTFADFGCGATGHFVFPAANIVGTESIVYAIDIQKSVLSSIEGRMKMKNISNVEPLWADIERLRGVKIEDEKLDLALLVNNLYLSNKKDELASELHRTVKSGGRLVVVDWEQKESPLGPPLSERVTQVIAQKLFIEHGFVLDHEFSAGQYHWGLVFKRK